MPIATFAAGETPPAGDFNDLALRLTIVSDTTVGTPATNFTDSGCFALTSDNGLDVEIVFSITTANLISQTSGNVTPDLLCFTLDAAYWPVVQRSAIAIAGGTALVGLQVGTDGRIFVMTSTANVAASALISGNVRYYRHSGS